MNPPPDAGQEPEDVHPLSTKEGWACFVAEETMPPEVLSPAAIQRLSPDQRTAREREREDYHAQLVIVRTPTIQHVTTTGRKRILLNRRQQSARRGLIVSGPAGTGKTTAITQLGKNYELLGRRRGEVGHQALPVVYVTVPPAATPKMLAVELARFIGLPLPSRFSQVDITNRVCDLLCSRSCRLVLIDELHNLDIRTKTGAEASDQIKYLSERIPATFVLAGVDVEDTGLFTGRRGGQIASRYTEITTRPFPHKTAKDKEAWQSLVTTLEEALRLYAHRPQTLLKLSAYLHDRTGGMIGSLSHLVREAALDAIISGTEKITRTGLDEVELDRAVAQQTRRRPSTPATRKAS
ncbi:AAA family ATPase [Streptomyces sp. NL15-2K]|uniref:AAA family ATPase n=1 Tax=Streptomyces sp. NL15-2K TaxID=376149 RepID=UPI000FFA9107|nr:MULTISPECIES: AAA family ATPase [Actinomycetes]WKX08074.1 AAA family ATPase [Kutzneria buriramensis]WKX10022.1 AAA family ATPase [Kutzneria buriramensis]WKX11649.1 AAA family ATPase [Kutzneria buriramensis]WKX12438.1 AAA family ATPase [Kutzneria buriramensis]WKX15835.1 AAA family ATPase [Kutzneria buriramensis]